MARAALLRSPTASSQTAEGASEGGDGAGRMRSLPMRYKDWLVLGSPRLGRWRYRFAQAPSILITGATYAIVVGFVDPTPHKLSPNIFLTSMNISVPAESSSGAAWNT